MRLPLSPRGQEGVNNTLNCPLYSGENREARCREKRLEGGAGGKAEQLSTVTFARCKAMWNDITLTSRPSDVPGPDCKGGEKNAKCY